MSEGKQEIDWSKPVRLMETTAEVTVITTNLGEPYPIGVLVKKPDGSETLRQYTRDGRSKSLYDDHIVQKTRKLKLTLTVTVTPASSRPDGVMDQVWSPSEEIVMSMHIARNPGTIVKTVEVEVP